MADLQYKITHVDGSQVAAQIAQTMAGPLPLYTGKEDAAMLRALFGHLFPSYFTTAKHDAKYQTVVIRLEADQLGIFQCPVIAPTTQES